MAETNIDIINKLNNCLLDTENLAEDFIPLSEKLTPIKDSVNSVLEQLKAQSENSDELSDKVFYLNRYADLIRKIDGIFDMRSKRLRDSLSMLSKLALVPGVNSGVENLDSANEDGKSSEGTNGISPETCAKLIAVLQGTDDSE